MQTERTGTEDPLTNYRMLNDRCASHTPVATSFPLLHPTQFLALPLPPAVQAVTVSLDVAHSVRLSAGIRAATVTDRFNIDFINKQS